MKQQFSRASLAAAVVVLTLAPGARSQEEATASAPEPSIYSELTDALFGGDVSLNLRLRAEIVEQAKLDTSQAYTERLRLGYGTNPFHGLSFFAEFEDTRSADQDLYNAAGLNGEPNKAVVADPENTELNQFYAKFENEYVRAIAGRQRMILDDVRFIGNVGWRQNEQTFDAYTVSTGWIEDTELLYSYIDDVNRIFGPDARRDFESDSHVINASYSGLSVGKITGFAYLLDFPNADAASSNTVGLRFNGKRKIPAECQVIYAASYAYQRDAGDNPADYEGHYFRVDGAIARSGLGEIGAAYEILTGDGDGSFQTPLATLHAHNGWADQFLTTPVGGLEDLMFHVGGTLPFEIKAKAVAHLFFSEEQSSDLGTEFDAVVSKAFTKNIAVLAKAAIFSGEAGLPTNVQKYWLQTEIKF